MKRSQEVSFERWAPRLAYGGVGLGLSSFSLLIWGLVARLDRWSAVPFVLLCYGIGLGAVMAWLGERWSKLAGIRLADWMQETRTLLVILSVAGVIWFFVPGALWPVGWIIRQLSLLRFR